MWWVGPLLCIAAVWRVAKARVQSRWQQGHGVREGRVGVALGAGRWQRRWHCSAGPTCNSETRVSCRLSPLRDESDHVAQVWRVGACQARPALEREANSVA